MSHIRRTTTSTVDTTLCPDRRKKLTHTARFVRVIRSSLNHSKQAWDHVTYSRILWMCLSLWPGGQGGLYPIFFFPTKRLTLLASSSSSLSLSALNLVGASYELATSSRFRATNFFCYNVGAALLHPGTGGHRLEALSMSDPSNSVAAAQT